MSLLLTGVELLNDPFKMQGVLGTKDHDMIESVFFYERREVISGEQALSLS